MLYAQRNLLFMVKKKILHEPRPILLKGLCVVHYVPFEGENMTTGG